MNVTTDQLQAYRGGQMEIQNQAECYIYRGEIATIALKDDEFVVRFAWFAKGDGLPPSGWTNCTDLDYHLSLKISAFSDIGDGRLSIDSPITGELSVLFPPNGSKLDPGKVVGLNLP